MIEDLLEYLKRIGWSEDIAESATDAYMKPYIGKDYWKDNVWRALEWMNDEEHDYVGEIIEDIQQWRFDSGEEEAGETK